MVSLVDILWGLNTIVARAYAVKADFLLSGPVNHWLLGISQRPRVPRLVLLTSPIYEEDLIKALSIGAVPDEFPRDLPVKEGLSLHVNLKGLSVSLLSNPVVETSNGIVHINVEDYARKATLIQVGEYFVRLSPLSLERILWGDNFG